MKRLACLLVLLVVGVAHAADDEGWIVQPPPGWDADVAAGAELAAKTKASFFGGGVDADGAVYRAPGDPERSKVVVQVMHMRDDDTPEQLVRRWTDALKPTAPIEHANADGTASADVRLADNVRMNVRARRDDAGTLHMLVVACSEPAGGTACAPVFASIDVGTNPHDSGPGLMQWILVGVVCVIGTVLVALARRRA